MSAPLCAKRTCSGPEVISTTGLAALSPPGQPTDRGSTAAVACSATPPMALRERVGCSNGCGSGVVTHAPVARRQAARIQGSSLFAIRLCFAAPRHRVKFKAMSDQFVTEFVGDEFLQLLDLLVAELD